MTSTPNPNLSMREAGDAALPTAVAFVMPSLHEVLHHHIHDRVRHADFRVRRFSDCEGDVEAPQFQGSRALQYFAAIAANMGALALGSVLSWSAVGIPGIRLEGQITMTASQEAWVGSIITLGAGASGPLAGYLIEKCGRRMSLLIMTTPFLGGWLLIAFAEGVYMMLAGRFITGFCSGVCAAAAPIFTAEMADNNIRGMLCAGFEVMINVGILIVFVCGAFMSWRVLSLIGAALPVIGGLMMLVVPESPRFLVQKGKLDSASKALIKFRGAKTDAEVEPELNGLRESVRNSEEMSGGCSQLCQGSVLRPISVVFLILFFQVATGIDPVILFTVDIFAASGAAIDEYYSTIIVGVVQLIAATGGAFLVEYFGRRLLLMISELAMSISLSLLGTYFYLKHINDGIPPSGLSWLPLTSLIVFMFAFSFGMGPVSFMISGEILPHNVKGIAGSILNSTKWLMSFIVARFFVDLIHLVGEHGCWWLFGGLCALGFFYVMLFVPETKGKTLDEIQAEFSKSQPAAPKKSIAAAPDGAGGDSRVELNSGTPSMAPSEQQQDVTQ